MYFGGFLRRSNYNQKKLQPEKKGRVRDHYYDRKKKILVVCLVGAQSLLRPEKSSSIDFGVTYIFSVQCTVVLLCQFFCLAGKLI